MQVVPAPPFTPEPAGASSSAASQVERSAGRGAQPEQQNVREPAPDIEPSLTASSSAAPSVDHAADQAESTQVDGGAASLAIEVVAKATAGALSTPTQPPPSSQYDTREEVMPTVSAADTMGEDAEDAKDVEVAEQADSATFVAIGDAASFEELIGQFRQALADRGVEIPNAPGETERQCLARWLRGVPYRGSVKHAVEKIVAYAKWRQEKGVDAWPIGTGDGLADPIGYAHANKVLGCDANIIQAFLPHMRRGTDRRGRPVLYKHLGRQFIVKGMNQHSTIERLIDYNCYFQEQHLVGGGPDGVYQWLYVIDVAGFNWTMFDAHTRRLIYGISKTDESFYPDMMGTLVVVNAPPSFAFAWRIMRKWMDPSTRDRAHIISEKSPELVTKVLLSYMDASELPSTYGGTAPPLAPWPDYSSSGSSSGSGGQKQNSKNPL